MAQRIEWFDTLPSTQTLALERLEAGQPGPGWICAHRQTGGVGRRGRAWWHGEGNFAGSYFERLPGNQLENSGPAGFSFAVGLAVIDALIADRPELDDGLTLKWPNDVLLHGGKVAGLLAQLVPLTDEAGAQAMGLVIGVGVNLAEAPPDLPDRAKDAPPPAAIGEPIIPVQTFAALLDGSLEKRLAMLTKVGPQPLIAAWTARAHGFGAPAAVLVNGERFEGVFAGVDPADGALVLRIDGSQRKFHSVEGLFFV